MSYELKKTSNDKFMFNLKAANHEIILTSQTYERKESALIGIASVQKNGPDASNFELKRSVSNEPYFVLKAGNAEVIGTSEMYSSEAAAKTGIASVQTYSPSTEIKES